MAAAYKLNIFINYRRGDSLDLARLTHKNLEERLEDLAEVFLDEAHIQLNDQDWENTILTKLKSADLVLCVIGPNWLESFEKREELSKEGKKSTDWVAKEIEIAMGEHIDVLPVFMHIRPFETNDLPGYLPDTLKEMLKRQAFAIPKNKFEPELNKLTGSLVKLAQHGEKANSNESHPTLRPLASLQLSEDYLDEIYNLDLQSPFLGPTYYKPELAAMYFGRDYDIRELYHEIRRNRIVLFNGYSGSGKSSLIHAGLLPRIESMAGWHLVVEQPIRRQKEAGGLAQQLANIENALENLPTDKRSLLLIDQVEEIYTNPLDARPYESETEQVRKWLYTVFKKYPQLHIVLAYRSEYHQKIRNNFILKNKLGRFQGEKYLAPLAREALMDCLLSPKKSPADGFPVLFNKYEIKTQVAEEIAKDFYGEDMLPYTVLFQVQMQALWNICAKDKSQHEKVEITRELYIANRMHELEDFLKNQLVQLKKEVAEAAIAIDNGLALDILYGYTTLHGTAGSKPDAQFLEEYKHLQDKLAERLLQGLKKYYLLAHSTQKIEGKAVPVSKLVHDTLALSIRHQYATSDALAQKARRIVEAKDRDENARLSETDIDTINKAVTYMKSMKPAFKERVEKDASFYKKRKLERFELFISNAQSNYEHLDFKTCLKELALAQAENFDNDAVLTLAQELICPLGLLGWEDEVESCKELISELGGDLLMGEKADAIKGRFLPKMIEIQGGIFKMGDVKGDNLYPEEKPVHKVSVSTFKLGETPITCWQYGIYCLSVGKKLPNDSGYGRGNRPMINVSWHEAAAYCNWLSVYYKLDPVYKIENNKVVGELWENNGFRLPTEAEWEYAASEGGQYRFGNGKDVASYEGLNYDVQHEYNQQYGSKFTEATEEASYGQTTPVKQYAPNGFGLYDMSGNVYEWCQDWYDEAYYKTLEDEVAKDPLGPKSSPEGYKTVRGGSWNGSSLDCRCAYRSWFNPISRNVVVGFRVSGR